MAKLTTKNTQEALNPIFKQAGFEAAVTCDASDIDECGIVTLNVSISQTDTLIYSNLGDIKIFVKNEENSKVSMSLELSKIYSNSDKLVETAKTLSALSMLLLTINTTEVHAAARADATIAFKATNEARNKKEDNLRKTHRQLSETEAQAIIQHVAGRTRELRGDTNRNVAHGETAKISFVALTMNSNGEIRNKTIQSEYNKCLVWTVNYDRTNLKSLVDMLTGMWVEHKISYKEVEAKLF